MAELSLRQRSILDFVQRFRDEQGYPPSIRDILTGCKISSTSVVDYNLKILEKRGWLRRHREVSRGIELLQKSRYDVPLIGTIAAGLPIPVPDNDAWDITAAAERIEVPPYILRDRENIYAIRVKGNSMIDALINDGDIVLMQSVNTVDNGAMAAVWLKAEREATLKKFYAEPGRVRLQPANTTMRPLFTSPHNVEVQGRVVGVMRRME